MSPLFPPIAFSQTSVPCLRAAVIEAVNWLLGRLVLQLWFPDKFKYFPRLITHTLTFLSEKWFFRAVVSSPQQPWSKAKISIIFLLFGPHKPDDKAFLLAGFCESQKASRQVLWRVLPFSSFLTQDFSPRLHIPVLEWPAAETSHLPETLLQPSMPSPPTPTCSHGGSALSDPCRGTAWPFCYSRGKTAPVKTANVSAECTGPVVARVARGPPVDAEKDDGFHVIKTMGSLLKWKGALIFIIY